MMIVVNMRSQAVQDLTSESPLKLDDLRKLIAVLKELPNHCPGEFPIHVKGLRQQLEEMPIMFVCPASRHSQ